MVNLAKQVQQRTDWLAQMATALKLNFKSHFGHLSFPNLNRRALAADYGFDVTCIGNGLSIALDECCTDREAWQLVGLIAGVAPDQVADLSNKLDEVANKSESFKAPKPDRRLKLEWPRVEGEVRFTRYVRSLVKKDLGLQDGMIPLGSCTMKLNSTATLACLTDARWTDWHPRQQSPGHEQLMGQLGSWLCQLMGMEAIWMRPNSGAQGEWSALMAIKSALKPRSVCLVPRSAHGTNAASARAAGMQVVSVAVDGQGRIKQEELLSLIKEHGHALACLMLTYPSTTGIFENDLFPTIIDAVHGQGGMVYLDGANFNAMAGWVKPGEDLKFDCMHLNLHKTMAIPHGGGGPGKGPIGMRGKLLQHVTNQGLLPNLVMADGTLVNRDDAVMHGSASLLPISWSYLRMLGWEGVRQCSAHAILNSHYLASLLENDWPLLNRSQQAHEFIIDCRGPCEAAGVSVVDIAKRLLVKPCIYLLGLWIPCSDCQLADCGEYDDG